MKTRFLFFVLVLALFFSQKSDAQSNCSENLAKAKSEFDDGHLYGISSLLNNCLSKGSRQDKIAAYELLTITYLYIDDPYAAQKSFKNLLELEPEYSTANSNYIELVHLSKEFITDPIIMWRARGGVNFSTISSIYTNSSNNSILKTEKYSLAPGWSVIGSLDIRVSKYLSFSLEPELFYNSFKYSDTFFNVNDVQNSKDQLNLQEKSYNVSLPISVKLTLPGEKFYPYIYGGYSPNYNLTTTTNAEYINKVGSAEITSTDNNIDLNTLREPFSNSAIIGIGLMRRVNYKYVFVDFRYKIGFSNRLLPDGQDGFDSNPDINKYLLTYKMIDNDFRQNEFSLTVGFVWPQYYARKRKSVTAKSFIGRIFKRKKDE